MALSGFDVAHEAAGARGGTRALLAAELTPPPRRVNVRPGGVARVEQRAGVLAVCARRPLVDRTDEGFVFDRVRRHALLFARL